MSLEAQHRILSATCAAHEKTALGRQLTAKHRIGHTDDSGSKEETLIRRKMGPRGQEENTPTFAPKNWWWLSPAPGAHPRPVYGALKYLDAGDGGNLFLQEIQPGAELLSDEVPAAASLQPGDQALVGQPELLSVICSRHPGD